MMLKLFFWYKDCLRIDACSKRTESPSVFSGMEMICDFQVEKHLWGKITYIKMDNALAEEKEELFTIKILTKCKFALPESYHLFIL